MAVTLIVTTVVSIVFAAVMGAIAWRLARDERRRSAVRVAALASDLRDGEGARGPAVIGVRPEPARVRQAARHIDMEDLELRHYSPDERAGAPVDELFRTAAAPGRSRSRLAAVLGVGTFAVATALALVIVTSGSDRSMMTDPLGPSSQTGPVAAQALAPAPPSSDVSLELIALGHDREGDRLTVRGVVRNPRSAVDANHVAAVVFLFDRDGGFLASNRAPVEIASLAPGAESTFVVTVGHAADVGRYRVSFKHGDRVIPHVDRRHPGPIAQLK